MPSVSGCHGHLPRILDEKPIPEVGPLDALMRVTTTTICGTDVHILKGEYPVAKGLTVGHEPVGIIERLGSAVEGFQEGQRVIAGAITPSGYSAACLCGCASQDGAWSERAAVASMAILPGIAVLLNHIAERMKPLE